MLKENNKCVPDTWTPEDCHKSVEFGQVLAYDSHISLADNQELDHFSPRAHSLTLILPSNFLKHYNIIMPIHVLE